MKLAIDPHVEQATQLLSFQNHSWALASSLKDQQEADFSFRLIGTCYPEPRMWAQLTCYSGAANIKNSRTRINVCVLDAGEGRATIAWRTVGSLQCLRGGSCQELPAPSTESAPPAIPRSGARASAFHSKKRTSWQTMAGKAIGCISMAVFLAGKRFVQLMDSKRSRLALKKKTKHWC